MFLSGSSNCTVTAVPQDVSLLLVSDSSNPAAVEAGTMNGYRLRLGDDSAVGGGTDALHLERASGSGWTTLRKDNLGADAILGDGWNLRVIRSSGGAWQYGYLVGNPVDPSLVNLTMSHSDATHSSGTHVGITFQCADGLRSDEWGFDEFRIVTVTVPSSTAATLFYGM